MNTETKKLLTRLQQLKKDVGYQRAILAGRLFWLIGLALCIFVVIAVNNQLHPTIIAIAAAVLGWVIAESNALRTRIVQWPIFKNYIDWKKVDQDLKESEH